ncbi:MAG TPA: L-arabinose isomerase, partial [Microbacterium sp.]|nr:L-arabinose isomerase [Microbacterium sp.]
MPLSTSFDGCEVWFVTGSQSLYGDETLRQVAEQARAVAEGLAGLPVKVVFKPVLIEP